MPVPPIHPQGDPALTGRRLRAAAPRARRVTRTGASRERSWPRGGTCMPSGPRELDGGAPPVTDCLQGPPGPQSSPERRPGRPGSSVCRLRSRPACWRQSGPGVGDRRHPSDQRLPPQPIRRQTDPRRKACIAAIRRLIWDYGLSYNSYIFAGFGDLHLRSTNSRSGQARGGDQSSSRCHGTALQVDHR